MILKDEIECIFNYDSTCKEKFCDESMNSSVDDFETYSCFSRYMDATYVYLTFQSKE